MRKNQFYRLSATLVLLFMLLCACRKNSTPPTKAQQDALVTQRFFNLPANAPEAVKAIAAQIKEQNNRYHFVPKLVAQNGYPLWAKVSSSSNANTRNATDEDAVYLIPFSASNSVDAYLFCKPSADSFVLRLNNKQALLNQLSPTDSVTNKRLIAKLKILAWMEKNVYNKDSIIINHPLIGGIKNATVQFGTNTGRQTGEFAEITVCGFLWIQSTAWVNGLAPGQPGNYGSWQFKCNTFTAWVNTTDEYLEENQTNEENWWDSGGIGGGLGDDGYQYNPDVANSIVIDQKLQDSFPCIASFISDSLPNANRFTQRVLYNVYGLSTNINLTFSFDNTLIGTDENAYTTPDTIANAINSYYFKATINLNPYLLTHGTNEAIISCILHEVLHAYIEYYFYLFKSGRVSEAVIKSRFPIFFDFLNTPPLSITLYTPPTLEHNIMASNHVDSIKNVVKRFWRNSSASSTLIDSVCGDLAWAGMTKTNVWNDKQTTEQCRILKTIIFARDTTNSTLNLTNPPCGIISGNYKDFKLSRNCN